MEMGFISPKEKGDGRGVKEKKVGSAGGSSFVSGSASKLGDDTSSKLGENSSSIPKGFVVSSKPFQSDVNVKVENVAGITLGQTPADNTPGNGVDVDVPVESIRAISERSSNARALIEVRADVELKDNIVVAMYKLIGKGFIRDECPKNIDSDVVKNMNKPSQTPRCVRIDPKVGFKLVKQVFTRVSKKNNVNTSGNKKKDVEPTIEVSNSNLFDVLNSVKNNVDLGTNERLIIERNVTFMDDEGKPLTNVDSSDDHDSEDEVASVDNDMSNFLASKKDGYGCGMSVLPLADILSLTLLCLAKRFTLIILILYNLCTSWSNERILQGNLMHCTTRCNIAHNFVLLKEGAIYSVRNFLVQPTKEDFRVMRFVDFMLEFDGENSVLLADVIECSEGNAKFRRAAHGRQKSMLDIQGGMFRLWLTE
ncbi:hypothetical protein Tco_0246550 [Tanacetum coccineum]